MIQLNWCKDLEQFGWLACCLANRLLQLRCLVTPTAHLLTTLYTLYLKLDLSHERKTFFSLFITLYCTQESFSLDLIHV